MRVGLEYIWMMDDNVSWFCQYSRAGEAIEDGHKSCLDFETALKRIEGIVQSKDCKGHLAAISPVRWRATHKTFNRFNYTTPQAVDTSM